MKKIIILSLAGISFLYGNTTFADIKILPATTTITSQAASTGSLEELTKKYDLILKNNNIAADTDYNSKNYYTKKIKTDNLIVPDEIKQKATRIYFLIEEGVSYMFVNKEMISNNQSPTTTDVKKEYNYKIVEYTKNKDEYIFNTKELVKDLQKNEYKSVNITLVAEFSNSEKLYLSNPVYVDISDKASVLSQLETQKNPDKINYFGYYDNQSLSNYLEKMSEKLSREDYKKSLNKANTKIKTLINKNEAIKKEIFDGINQESDFDKNVDKYSIYSQTDTLLRSIQDITNQQIQKIRAYEVIDEVYGKNN